jgi:hypothetical protein
MSLLYARVLRMATVMLCTASDIPSRKSETSDCSTSTVFASSACEWQSAYLSLC